MTLRIVSALRMRGSDHRQVAGFLLAAAFLVLFAFAAAPARAEYGSVGEFAGPGSGDGQLDRPAESAVEHATGNLFVVDSANDRIQVFAPDGVAAGYLTQFGAGDLDDPRGIAIDETGGQTRVYVADAGHDRIVRFDSDEQATPAFTLDTGYTSPTQGGDPGQVSSFRSALALAPNGDLWVADSGADVLKRFDSTGAYVLASDIDGFTSSAPFTGLIDVATNAAGDLYVVDVSTDGDGDGDQDLDDLAYTSPANGGSTTSRVERFSAGGAHQATLAGLTAPGAVTVDPATQDALVAADENSYWSNAPLSVHRFDGATDAETQSLQLTGDAIGGAAIYALMPTLAAAPGGRLYAVVDRNHVDDPTYGVGVGIVAFQDLTPPTATISPVTDVAAFSATLNGEVDPNGSATRYRFEYSSDSGASWTATETQDLGDAGDDPVAVTAEIAGLPDDTAFQVRLVALKGGGSIVDTSPEVGFSTLDADPPTVALEPATDVTASSITFHGSVDAEGSPTTYRFEYSQDEGASWTPIPDPAGDAGTDVVPVAVEATAENLEPNLTVRVRLVASNGAGESTSPEQDIDLESAGPTAVTYLTGDVQPTSARLTGLVEPNNAPTTYYFEWGTKPDLSDAQSLPVAQDGDAGSDGEQHTVVEDLTGLTPSTTYYFRVTADSPIGAPAVGEIQSFQTYPAPAPDADCPNAAIRKQQRSEFLPDCRAYELVSNPRKTVPISSRGGQVSTDGNRVYYETFGGTDDTISGGVHPATLSERSATGWHTSSPLPDRSRYAGAGQDMKFAAPDLTAFMFGTGPLYGSGAEPGYVYTYRPPTDELTLNWEYFNSVSDLTTDLPPINATVEVVSDDLSVSVADVKRSLSPADPSSIGGLYQFGPSGQPEFIGYLPGEVAPLCGVGPSDWPRNDTQMGGDEEQNKMSADGRRVFFHTRGDDCDGPAQLYLREGGVEGSTTLISGPALSGPQLGARFSQASDDGSKVVFTTATRLDPDDSNSVTDIYRHVIGAGNQCLTCSVADPAVDTPGPGENTTERIAPSEDTSRVYFVSPKALAPGGRPGAPNIYVWREADPERFGFVGVFGPLDATSFGFNDENIKQTAAGDVAYIRSSAAQLDRLTDTANGGFKQVYRYDDRTRALTCVSCPPGHAATGDAPHWQLADGSIAHNGQPIVFTEDGKTFFFESAEALVSQDIDGQKDVYQWRDGETRLLTQGRVRSPEVGSDRLMMGMSPDGRTVSIASWDELAGVPAHGRNLYVARVNGGVAVATALPGCAAGECQGSPSAPPPDDSAASETFSGPGNRASNRAVPRASCSIFRTRVAKAKRQLRRSASRSARVKAKKKLKRANRQFSSCKRSAS